jgi:hypothetical protein
MPPQPGVFPLPYASTSTHKSRANHTEIHNGTTDMVTSYPPPPHHSVHHPSSSSLLAGPSSRPHGTFLLHLRHVLIHSFVSSPGANTDDGKKDRRRKEIIGRLGKEMNDRRDECVSSLCFLLVPPAFKQGRICVPSGRQYAESISALHSVAMQLAARPETLPSYTLRLYPLSIERSALLAQLAVEERNSLESAEAAYELERERVEEEWKRGRDRIRERLLEGIEERRRRARDEKDGEGTVSGTWAFHFFCSATLLKRFLQRPPSIPSRVHTSRVNFVTDSAHHLLPHLSHHTPTVSQMARDLRLQDQSRTRTRSPSMSSRHPSHCHLPQHRYLT